MVTIYWLFDTRPETIALTGWKCGVPFYCGQTLQKKEKRLAAHIAEARRAGVNTHRPAYKMLLQCGAYIRVDALEFVETETNARVRERYWIAVLRRVNADTTNIKDGGELLYTAERSAKISAAHKGKPKPKSEATCAKLRAAWAAMTKEERAARFVGRKYAKGSKRPAWNRWYASDDTRAKMRAAKLGKKRELQLVQITC